MKRLSTILLLFILFSCEMVMEVKMPETSKKLVINGLFKTDSTWRLSISHIQPIQQSGIFHGSLAPQDLVLTITGSDGTINVLHKRDSGPIGLPDLQFFESMASPSAGITYTLRASATGYPDAVATSIAPENVEIINVELDSSRYRPEGDGQISSIPIEFTFSDPAGPGDYYVPKLLIKQIRRGQDQYGNEVDHVSWFVAAMTEGIPGGGFTNLAKEVMAFDDAAFDGKLHTCRLFATRSFFWGDDSRTWKFVLMHMKKDHYKYLQSTQLQQSVADNPFAQPVQLHTNVDGGFGIFAGASVSTWMHD